MPNPERSKWALVLIHLSGQVEGRTRLQKLAFLCKQMIGGLKDTAFYDDWMAGRFGPFSPTLASDVGELVSTGFVGDFAVPNDYGYNVTRFTLLADGTRVAEETIQANQKVIKQMKDIIKRYANAPLMEILHDVYTQFPKYIERSEIRARVERSSSSPDSELSQYWDESQD